MWNPPKTVEASPEYCWQNSPVMSGNLKPDIVGSLVNANANYQQTVATGAIAITSGADYGNTSKAGNTRPNWTFYASRSNNKYGQSSTIQPLSFQTLIIVKCWKDFGWTNVLLPYILLEPDAAKVNCVQPHLADESPWMPNLPRGKTMEKQPEPDGKSPINWFVLDLSS